MRPTRPPSGSPSSCRVPTRRRVMHRRREPARPVSPPTAETRPALMARGDAGPGRHCGAPSGRDSGHRRSRSCAVFGDGTTMPVVAAPGPRDPGSRPPLFLPLGQAGDPCSQRRSPDRPPLTPNAELREMRRIDMIPGSKPRGRRRAGRCRDELFLASRGRRDLHRPRPGAQAPAGPTDTKGGG